MPPAQVKVVNMKQAVAVGILAGLIVIAIVLTLETMQRKRMWKEVDDALATDAARNATRPERKPDERNNGTVGGFRNGEPIPGVPGDGLDGEPIPPPGGSDA